MPHTVTVTVTRTWNTLGRHDLWACQWAALRLTGRLRGSVTIDGPRARAAAAAAHWQPPVPRSRQIRCREFERAAARAAAANRLQVEHAYSAATVVRASSESSPGSSMCC